jgi:hypothetical protein
MCECKYCIMWAAGPANTVDWLSGWHTLDYM